MESVLKNDTASDIFDFIEEDAFVQIADITVANISVDSTYLNETATYQLQSEGLTYNILL